MKKIELNPDIKISQPGNRSDQFGIEISDLFSHQHEKLAQIIDLSLKEHVDLLPSRYEYILQGVVYYFFTNKELLGEISQGDLGYERQRFQESFKTHYRHQPKAEDIKKSLFPFAQRVIGWRAKTVFKGNANSKYDELFSREATTNRDEDKLDEITLGLVSNYIARELKRTLENQDQANSRQSTEKTVQLDIAKSIVQRYKQEAKLQKLIQGQVDLVRNSVFYVKPEAKSTQAGAEFLGGSGGGEWTSKKDYFGFFEHYIDLTQVPLCLTDPNFFTQHHGFKKIMSDYYDDFTVFGFGLDERKAAAGAVLWPKVTKLMNGIKEKFDLKEKLFPVDEIEFIRYGDHKEKLHIQKTGKRVKSANPDGYTQLVSKIIPHKNLIDIVASFQNSLNDYCFSKNYNKEKSEILAHNKKFEITKEGIHPYYVGHHKQSGHQLVFVSLANNLKEHESKYSFFAPIGSFGEYGFQPIGEFYRDFDQFFSTHINMHLVEYSKEKGFELDKNEIDFVKKSMLIWFATQPDVGTTNKATIDNIQQIYETVFAQTERSQVKDGNKINPVYGFSYLGNKNIPSQDAMFQFVTKDLGVDKKLSENNVLKVVNLGHLMHFKPSQTQLNQLATYINSLVQNGTKTIDINSVAPMMREFEKEVVIDSVNKIEGLRERIITTLRNIWVAHHNKDHLIEKKLIDILKQSCGLLIQELELDITKSLDLCESLDQQPRNEEIRQTIREVMSQISEDTEHVGLLRYFLELPDQNRDFVSIKKEVIKRTTVEKQTSWKTSNEQVLHGTEHDSLFNDGAGYEILFTDHIFGVNKERLQYSGGSKTLLDKASYSPKAINNNLDCSPILRTQPSELWHKDNDAPLPLCELPQIRDFINHYLAYQANNSSLNHIKMLNNDMILRQRLFYFIKKPKYLITFLELVQNNKLYSGQFNPVRIWISNIIAGTPNPHNFENISEYGNYAIDEKTVAEIFYHLGYINPGEGRLQTLGIACSEVPEFDGLEPEFTKELNTIQFRVEYLAQQGFIEKKLLRI